MAGMTGMPDSAYAAFSSGPYGGADMSNPYGAPTGAQGGGYYTQQQQYPSYSAMNGYTYTQSADGGMTAIPGESCNVTQIGMDPATMSSSGQLSFIMPQNQPMGSPEQQDPSLQAFQQSFGNGFSFYDVNPYGNCGIMPQGYSQSFDRLGGEKKAIKISPSNGKAAGKPSVKAKRALPCC